MRSKLVIDICAITNKLLASVGTDSPAKVRISDDGARRSSLRKPSFPGRTADRDVSE